MTYFVQSAKDLTGEETGYTDSDNIYMLRDGEKEPELLAVLPVLNMGDVYCLYPTEDKLYFLTGLSRSDWSIMEIDYGTKKISEAVSLSGNYRIAGMPVISEDGFFIRYRDEDGFGALKLDTDSNTVKELDLSYIENDEPKVFVGMNDEFTYYVKCTSDLDPYGIFRADEEGNEQDVCALPQDFDGIPFVLDDYVVYWNEEDAFGGKSGVVFVNIDTGKKYYVLSKDELQNDLSINVFGDYVYYIDEKKGISRKQITGENEAEQLMEGRTDFDIVGLAIINDDLLLINKDDLAVYRTRLDGRVIPAAPIIKSLADSYEVKQEGDWEYKEYQNCVDVSRYCGSETDVTIPEEIGGKPVTIVSLWQSSQNEEHIRKLTIPDTVVSINWVEDRSIETLIIPKSVKHFTYHGFEHSINIAQGATIIYKGSESEWQALITDNAERFSDVATDTSGTEDPKFVFEALIIGSSILPDTVKR